VRLRVFFVPVALARLGAADPRFALRGDVLEAREGAARRPDPLREVVVLLLVETRFCVRAGAMGTRSVV
jgi:hypothetical protein